MSTLADPLVEVCAGEAPAQESFGGNAPRGRTFRIGQWAACAALTFAALFIHGYHPYAEDAGIYLPAIKKELHPALYPRGSEFFTLQAHWSLFTRAVAWTARLSHLPLPYMLLLWYLASLFFIILACWRIAELCFESPPAGGSGAALVAAAISMPAAGCALLLCDPYLSSRSVSTPLILFSIVCLLRRQAAWVFFFWAASLAFHPLMAAIAGVFLVLLVIARSPRWLLYFSAALTLVLLATIAVIRAAPFAVTNDYRAAALTRRFFFLNRWHWYELFGAIAPPIIFAFIAWTRRKTRDQLIFQLSLATALFGLSAIIGGIAVTWVPGLFALARFQPMRAYQLIYLLFLLVPVNVAISRVGRKPLSRHLVFSSVVLLLGAGMYIVQRSTFSSSAHIEWPWSEQWNSWQKAFEWVRANTPNDAVFALDPNYSDLPGDDEQLFRAEAERSALPDRAKDGGVAALFPQLAGEWEFYVGLVGHLHDLKDGSDAKLRQAGATWALIPAPPDPRFDCPYSNERVSVCRLTSSPQESMSAAVQSRRVVGVSPP